MRYITFVKENSLLTSKAVNSGNFQWQNQGYCELDKKL